MKGKIAQRYFTDQVEPALREAMHEFGALTGRYYELIEPYGMEDAEYAIVAMGTMAETATATVDYLRRERGIRVGVPFTFIDFARTEGRFAKQFDAEGAPSEALRAAEADRLANWHLLQELAGLK